MALYFTSGRLVQIPKRFFLYYNRHIHAPFVAFRVCLLVLQLSSVDIDMGCKVQNINGLQNSNAYNVKWLMPFLSVPTEFLARVFSQKQWHTFMNRWVKQAWHLNVCRLACSAYGADFIRHRKRLQSIYAEHPAVCLPSLLQNKHSTSWRSNYTNAYPLLPNVWKCILLRLKRKDLQFNLSFKWI